MSILKEECELLNVTEHNKLLNGNWLGFLNRLPQREI